MKLFKLELTPPVRALSAFALMLALPLAANAVPIDCYVEYLESTGSQYIDTGYVFRKLPRIEARVMQKTTSDRDLVGSSVSTRGPGVISVDCAGEKYYYYFGSKTGKTGTSTVTLVNSWVDYVWTDQLIHNGVVQATQDAYDFSNTTATFWLFGSARAKAIACFQGVKIYDDGVLVRDFRPAISGGVAGMHDVLNDDFYANAGTGDFKTGEPLPVTASMIIPASSVGVVRGGLLATAIVPQVLPTAARTEVRFYAGETEKTLAVVAVKPVTSAGEHALTWTPQDGKGKTYFTKLEVLDLDADSQVIASSATEVRTCELSAYDAYSYVPTGLVAQWDGIDNLGRGLHDATAKTWVDLSGNGNDVVQADGKALPWKNGKSIERTAKTLISAPTLRFDFDRAFTLDFCGEQPTAANAYIIQTKPTGYYYAGGFQTVNSRKMTVNHGSGSFTTTTALYTGHSLVAWRDGTTLGFHDAASDTVELKTAAPLGYNGLMPGPFAIASDTGGGTMFTTPFYALRLYNRVLSRQEYRWNEIVDDIRFRGVTPQAVEFTVDPLPADFPVTTTPAAGTTQQKADGISVEFSISGLSTAGDGSLVADVETGVRAKLYGWKVGRGGPGTDSYSSVTGTGSSGVAAVGTLLTHLTWDVRRQYQVTVNAANGTVSVGGGAAAAEQTVWVDAGMVTLTATPDAGATFSHWEGAGDVADPYAATITLPINKVQTIKAVCASSAHVPETVTWKNVNGDWHNAANWDTGRVPEAGDTVVIAPPKNDYTITLSYPTPRYASVSISNGAAKNKTTLAISGWQTCLQADEIVIGDNAIVKPAAAFNFNEPSNRVWMVGRRLTVSENGKVDANGCGCKEYCWRAVHIGSHPNQSGVYGANFLGNTGYGYLPAAYGSAEWPTMAGSCSDAGTAGGAIRLDFTGAVTIDGIVRANGSNNGSRTGSGGGILIVCDTISGSGEVLAKPYDPRTDGTKIGAGGGGGRIAVHYDTAAQAAVSDCTVRFDASSGIASDHKLAKGTGCWSSYGLTYMSEDYIMQQPPGTLWLSDNRFLTAASYRTAGWKFGGAWMTPEPIGALTFDQPLVLNHCNLYLPASCTSFDAQSDVTLTGSGLYARHSFGLVLDGTPTTIAGDLNATGAALDVKGASLTVAGDVNLTKPTSFANKAFDNAYAGGEVIVRAGATNGTDQAYGSTFAVAGNVNVSAGSSVYLPGEPNDGAIVYMSAKNVTVDEGGKIDSEYGGWGQKLGPGAGALAQAYEPGASYGGRGTPLTHWSLRPTYGSERQPLDLGSGGYSPGGGAVRLAVKQLLTLNGEINADGGPQLAASTWVAGSGGSVYVTAARITGSGHLSAAGGLCDNYKSAGGGGRVAVWVQSADGWTGTASAEGGYNHTSASASALTEKLAEDGTVFWSIGSILSVSAEPKLFGGVSPALGDMPNLQGDTIEFALTGGVAVAGQTLYPTAAGDERALFAGALVITGGGEVTNRVTTMSFSRAINEDTSVVWTFDGFQRHLTVDSPANGLVSLDGGAATNRIERWIGANETVTLTATPTTAGLFFCRWEGDTNGLDAASATITVDGSCPRNLFARYWDGEHIPVTATWTGASGGKWSQAGNWDIGAVPGRGDVVIIKPSAELTINIDAPTAQLGSLLVDNTGKSTLTTLSFSGWETCLRADEITVGAQAVVTTPAGTKETDSSNRVWMAGMKLTVVAGGTIDVTGKSAMQTCYRLIGKSTHPSQGGIYGGAFLGNSGYGVNPVPYGSAEWPVDLGSKGYAGLAGGAIRLDFTGDVIIDGAIKANGDRPWANPASQGGSGGSVLISCRTVTGSGEVMAKPYDTRTTGSWLIGAAAGGGRIAVHYDSSAQAVVTDCTVRFDASSGICHDPKNKPGQGNWGGYGESDNDEDNIGLMPPGSLWFPDNQFLRAASYRAAGWKFGGLWSGPVAIGALAFNEHLTLDNCNLELPESCTAFTARGGLLVKGRGVYARRDSGLHLNGAEVTVDGDLDAEGARLEIVGGSLTVNGDVNLTTNAFASGDFNTAFAGGEVAVKAAATNGTDAAYGAVFTVAGAVNISTNSVVYLACHRTDGAIPYMSAENVTVEKGGRISAENGGWDKLLGPGRGGQYSPGASHGGRGGGQYSRAPYGSMERPVDPGSAGGLVGGGVVRLDVANALVMDGVIQADASKQLGGQYASAGAGGSVFVKTKTLSGTGAFSAAGGLSDGSNYQYSAGGGGRVAVWAQNADDWAGTATAEGGYKHESGGYSAMTEKCAEDGTVFVSIGSTLVVKAVPTPYGTVTPSLGETSGHQGETLDFALTGGVLDNGSTYYPTAAGDERALFAGALVITDGGKATNNVDATSFSQAIGEDTSVVWIFNSFQSQLTIEVPANGSIRVNNEEPVYKGARWIDKEESVTLTALPAGELLFFRWEGDTNDLDATSATITVDGSRPRNLVAKFWDGEHEPVSLTWTGTAASAEWDDPANWDKGQVPGHFDIVTIRPTVQTTISITNSTARLGKLVLGPSAINSYGNVLPVTIKMTGWETCLAADEIEILDNVTVTTVGGFKCTESSNRVWLAGSKLTIREKGKISAIQCGCIDRAWVEGGCGTHYLQGGIYGGKFRGNGETNAKIPVPYGSAEWPTDPGSGASTSSAGKPSSCAGGAIRLDFAGDVVIDGKITSDGILGGYSTGGSGGSVLLQCRTVTGSGEVTARSTSMDTDKAQHVIDGGGGGGGRIAVHYDPSAQAEVTDCTVRFDASSDICHDPQPKEGFGCWSGYGRNESAEDYIMKMPQGTLWFPDNQFLTAASYRTAGWKFGGLWSSPAPVGALVFDQPIVFDSCDLELPASCTALTAQQGVMLKGGNWIYGRRRWGLYLTNAVATVTGDLNAVGARFEIVGGSLTVNGDVNLTQDGASRTNRFSGGEVAIKADATNGTDRAYGAMFTVTGAINISTNAVVYLACEPKDGAIPYVQADRMTVAAGGKVSALCGGWDRQTGPGRGEVYSPGGTHGGRGAPTNKVALTKIYGLRRRPVAPGSGGFFSGGGVVRIDLDRTLELDGTIEADANRLVGNQYGSGGAGGSVYLRVPQLSGSGLVSAAGGLSDQSSYNFAAGGGGRVAIWTRDAANWAGSVSAEGGYKQESSSSAALTEKTAEDGTVFWHNLPGGTLIFVR